MALGARTPEELETLLEDAFLLRDEQALAELFEDRGVLVVDGGDFEAHGGGAIVRLAAELWHRDCTYRADRGRVLQATATALVLTPGGINVARRGDDGTWRYAISFLHVQRGVQDGKPHGAGTSTTN